MEKEYNLLTKRLLAEGYTAEKFPDYVQISSSKLSGDDPLHNLDGGFEYIPEYRAKLVFRTGCGLLLKGSHFSCGHMNYMGIKWIPENDNPVITCPYRKDTCDLRNPLLEGAEGGGILKISRCDCHLTDEEYDYEKSYDKVSDDEKREKKRKYEEFAERVKGHVCHWHMRYNDWRGEWQQKYDPMVCAAHCLNKGGICHLTGKPISKKKGNVFYDVKVSYIRRDGTLFDGEEVIHIKKGVRLFETNKSVTICEEVAKRCETAIIRREKDNYHSRILLLGWTVEVLNIRAEQRESRDLLQDLQDIRDGITVTHASDEERNMKAAKRERTQRAKDARIAKLEKKLLDVGYCNLDEYSLDRRHADKWLGEERIAELEEMRKAREEQGLNRPKQITLFDFLEE